MKTPGIRPATTPASGFNPPRSLLRVVPDDRCGVELALVAGADALVFDLTAGAPDRLNARREALAALLRAASSGPAPRPRLLVQVHGLDTGETDADLDAAMPGGPHGLVLRRSRSGADVQQLGAKLAVREAEFGLADGATWIIAMAGASATGLLALSTYAGASRRLAGLAWDAAELAGDLGADATALEPDTGGPFDLARSLTVIGARAAGRAAFDGPTASPDPAVLAGACARAGRMGFDGKFAADAAQVAVINARFGRSNQDV